ncbi:MAG TPA: serine/threonine-protein kinase [Anaerolineaceae bacterium]|nr:serine/threonine-protein kinase [Anaerolineaceae bacterium]
MSYQSTKRQFTDRLIGARIDEYQLEALLGKGGMARVYRAVDINVNRRVAIKVIDLDHRADEDYAQRFKREAQAIARLDHPHIVRLYRYGDGQLLPLGERILYMAMQFIDGADLQYVLNSYRKDHELIEPEEAARLIREICSALDYAHEQGIVHRDIKPSNIMLNSQGRAILTDFGLAMLSTQATIGEVFGSPDYIAPEQAESSAKAVPQSDLYAVGVILYEMFTGVLPFTAQQPLEVALMHLHAPVPLPRSIRPEISQELEAVILRALEKRPEERYPTGKALAEAVDAAVAAMTPAAPVTRLTIPERVTQGLALQRSTLVATQAHPSALEPTMKSNAIPNGNPSAVFTPPATSLEAPAVPGAQMSHPATPPAATVTRLPATRMRKPTRWVIAVLTSLILFSLCLGGAIFLPRFLGNRGQNFPLPAGVNPSATSVYRPTQTIHSVLPVTPSASPTRTSRPTQTAKASTRVSPIIQPSATLTGLYELKITRQGEKDGYLILANIGKMDIPLQDLSLRTEKESLSGSDLYIDQLKTGECLLARKKDSKPKDFSSLVSCQLVGPTILISNSQDGVFKDELGLYRGSDKVGVCDREESMCLFSFED